MLDLLALRDLARRDVPVAPLLDGLPLLSPEVFRVRAEEEAARHRRHLGGFALLRIGVSDPVDQPLLDEAAATETRRTDSVCRQPDGSYALLLVQAREGVAAVVTARIERTMGEIAGGRAVSLVAGAAHAGRRRVDAEELWRAASRAYLDASRREPLAAAAH